MKKFKVILDIKSFVIGLLGCLLYLSFSGFKPGLSEQVGRYQVDTGESRTVILDTATGDFIQSCGNQWQRQKFGEENVYSEYNPWRKFRKEQVLDK